jgi:hypothetical protein
VWQIASLAALAGRAGMAAGRAAAASVIAQVAFISTGLLFLGAVLPRWTPAIDDQRTLQTFNPGIAGAAILIGTALIIWVLVATPAGHGFRTFIIRRADRGLGQTAGGRIGSALALVDQITLRSGVIWAIGYAASWILLGAAFLLFVLAFYPAAAQHAAFAAGVVTAAYLSGYVAFFLPAGAGVREVTMGVLLGQIMPVPAAAMIAVASRVWFTAAELLPLALIPLAPERATPASPESRPAAVLL